jgi:hypothetical protein
MNAREVDRKLRLTSIVVGAVTRKDLAAAFRRANPATTFDLERAHKWLQGRARPRDRQLYEDWAKVLDLGRSGQWIAECDIDGFLDAVSARFEYDRDGLERRERDTAHRREAAGNGAAPEPDASLVGTFATYSHAWSPYFRGQLICGELSIRSEPNPPRLVATYVENLPTGLLQVEGAVTTSQRTLNLDLSHPDRDVRFSVSLFRPAPPVSFFAGYLTGASFLSSEVELNTTRIVLIRLPPASDRRSTGAYLPADASLAADLAALGLPIRAPAEIDRQLSAFLTSTHNSGMDRITAAQYLALSELFDQNWLMQVGAAKDRGCGANNTQ